jgi:hypothetical protein
MVRNDTEIPHPSPLLIKEREKDSLNPLLEGEGAEGG